MQIPLGCCRPVSREQATARASIGAYMLFGSMTRVWAYLLTFTAAT